MIDDHDTNDKDNDNVEYVDDDDDDDACVQVYSNSNVMSFFLKKYCGALQGSKSTMVL